MTEQAQNRSMMETKTLAELCSVGWSKYDQAIPIDIGTEDGGAIVLRYCQIPEHNNCQYKMKSSIRVNGKEYYFCRKTR